MTVSPRSRPRVALSSRCWKADPDGSRDRHHRTGSPNNPRVMNAPLKRNSSRGVDPRSGCPARCLACSRCRRFRFVATTDRWCWPNEVDASAYSGAVSKNSVVRQSAETTGLHELRTGPGFDDPLACCVGTVGIVWIVDE